MRENGATNDVNPNATQHALMMERVHALYERHQQQGLVQLNYVARVFAGVVSNL